MSHTPINEEQEPRRKPFVPSDKLCEMLSERAHLTFTFEALGHIEDIHEEVRDEYYRKEDEMTVAIEAQQAAEGFVPAKAKQP